MALKITPSHASQTVRSQARAHLAQLRAERLSRARARRRSTAPTEFGSAAEGAVVPKDLVDTLEAANDAVEETPIAHSSDEAGFDAAGGTDDIDMAETTDTPFQEDDPALNDHAAPDVPSVDADPAVEEVSGSDDLMAGDDPALAEDTLTTEEIVPTSAPTEAEATLEPEEMPEEPAPRSDLFDLPGAGPGLVWMLESSGVKSLAELAVADADQLETEMGLVARILDLKFWISFAQDQQDTGDQDS